MVAGWVSGWLAGTWPTCKSGDCRIWAIRTRKQVLLRRFIRGNAAPNGPAFVLPRLPHHSMTSTYCPWWLVSRDLATGRRCVIIVPKRMAAACGFSDLFHGARDMHGGSFTQNTITRCYSYRGVHIDETHLLSSSKID